MEHRGSPSSPGNPTGSPDRFALSSRLRSERGVVSLLELLTSIPMMLVIVAGVFMLYELAKRDNDRVDSRVRTLSQQQSGLEKMQRELRQATSITPTSSQIVDMNTYVTPAGGTATAKRVRYDCTGGSCKRYEGNVGALTWTSGPVTVISNVLNANVFAMEPDYVNPSFVALNLDVSVRGASRPIALTGGVTLRNQARDS